MNRRTLFQALIGGAAASTVAASPAPEVDRFADLVASIDKLKAQASKPLHVRIEPKTFHLNKWVASAPTP